MNAAPGKPGKCAYCGSTIELFSKITAEDVINLGKEENPSGYDSKDFIHASGLTRSHKTPSYWKIPLELLQCLAERFDLGSLTRNPGTDWYSIKKESIDDDAFYLGTLNHAQEHLSKLMNGDFTEDDEWGHLGAIAFMCAVRAWRLKNRARYTKLNAGQTLQQESK